jgi:hypothetical protein
MRARALSLLAAIALAALVLGLASLAKAAPGSGPKITSAKLVTDGGIRGTIDAGDEIRITFNRDIKIATLESFGVDLVGDNGAMFRLTHESAPYGCIPTVRGKTLTLAVNLDPWQVSSGPLTYPAQITHFWHVVGKDQDRPINLLGSRDRVIS